MVGQHRESRASHAADIAVGSPEHADQAAYARRASRRARRIRDGDWPRPPEHIITDNAYANGGRRFRACGMLDVLRLDLLEPLTVATVLVPASPVAPRGPYPRPGDAPARRRQHHVRPLWRFAAQAGAAVVAGAVTGAGLMMLLFAAAAA
jgi:hypothetical protein